MSEERVLLVGGSNEMFAYRTVLSLAEEGIATAAVTPNRYSSIAMSRHVRGATRMPAALMESMGDESAAALHAAVVKHRADVVFPTDLDAVPACTAAAAHLSVPVIAMPSSEVVGICHDKGRFAELLDQIGCAQAADSRVIDSLEQIDEIVFDRPMIAKPIEGDGGIGVKRVNTADELVLHAQSGLPGTGLPLLLQEFIPGFDIDCSFYAEKGEILAWAVQKRRSGTDPLIEFVRDDRVVDLCAMFVEALGYDGLGHADLRVDERDGALRVIELNPRVWGSVHYAAFMGANFPVLAVRRALGQQVPIFRPPVGSCRNPRLDALSVIKSLTGRAAVAPTTLNAAEQRMFVSKHFDPIPAVSIRLRSMLWRIGERARVPARLTVSRRPSASAPAP